MTDHRQLWAGMGWSFGFLQPGLGKEHQFMASKIAGFF